MADGKVIIEIDGDPSKLESALDHVGDSISDIGSAFTKNVTLPVLAAGTAAVKFASDYEENLNKVDVAFKESADQVKAWATTATEQFGMSESAALEATSLFGDMGTSMGLTSAEAANMSVSLAGLAGDLASFKNIGIDEAMTALKGVFTGETESLKMLGVVMTETNLKEFAKGLGLVYDEMNQAQKVTLRYKYVLAQTENAQGDYIRTSDGTANSVRTLLSSVENLGAAFGEELLPTITPIIQDTTELIKKFGELDDSTKEMIIQAALFAAATGPVISGVGKLTSTAGSMIEAGRTLNALFNGGVVSLTSLVGPATAATVAFAGLIAAYVAAESALYKTSDEVNLLNQANQENVEMIEQVNAALDTSIEKYATVSAEIGNAKTSNENLISNVVALAAGYDGTASSAQAVIDVVDQLNAAIPGLNLAFDEQTGKLNRTEEALVALNNQYVATQQYNAALEAQASAFNALTEARSALADAESNAFAAETALNDALREGETLSEALTTTDRVHAKAVGDLYDAYVSATGAVYQAKITVGSCEGALESAERATDAYAETYYDAVDAAAEFTEETEDTTDALTEEAEAAAEATKSMGKIGTAAYDAMRSGGNLRETYEDLRREMDELTGSGDPYIESLAEQALYMLDVAATAQELETTYGGLTDVVWASSTQMSADLVAVGMSADDFAAGCESMRDRVINSFETIQVNEELTAQQIAENLANNLAVHNEWSSNLISLWNSTQDETIRAFVLYMYDQGPEYALAVSQFANGGSEALASAAESWAAIGDSTVAGYYARVAGEASLSEATTSGEQVTDSVAAGMEDEIPAAEAAADAATAAVLEVWDTASPSFQTAGTTAGQKINEGLASQKSSITTTSNTTASAVESAFTTPSWYGVGYNVSSGIASGVSGGSYLITNAATAAAWAAYYAAKSALEINSPSKLMEDDIGYQSAAGVAVGWKKGTREIVNEVEASADLMHSTAQIAMRPSSIGSDYQTLYSSATRSILGNGRGGVIVIEVPLSIDGRELTRATARYTSDQLEFLEV